jgi:cation transport regulator ChaC
MEAGKLYFAYGSNLYLKQLVERLERKISPIQVVFMADMELFFPRSSIKQDGGVASFRGAKGKKLWGALFEVTESDLDKLDIKEGAKSVPKSYERKQVAVYDESGNEYNALTYEAVVEGKYLPSRAYMQKIISGAEECKLPKEYIQHLKNIKMR